MSMNFFYQPDREVFTITDEMIEVIRNLKYQLNTGDWYENQPRWRLLDNNIPPNISFGDIGKAMQFLTMTADIDGDIPTHFKMLLRRTYIDHYDSGNSSDGLEVIVLAGKRPFGNSHVEGDVREVLIDSGFYGNKNWDDFDGDDNFEIENEELQKYIKFLIDDFFKNFKTKYYSFKFLDRMSKKTDDRYTYWEDKLEYIHSSLYNWEIDISEIRDRKLQKVLND